MDHGIEYESPNLGLGEWLRRYRRERGVRQQANYITRRLVEEFPDLHICLEPRLMSDEELEEIVAEMLAYGRYLVARRTDREPGPIASVSACA